MTTTGRDADFNPLLLPLGLRTLESGDGRRVSFVELFFDLVFVVAIAQLAHGLVVDHWPGAGRVRRGAPRRQAEATAHGSQSAS